MSLKFLSLSLFYESFDIFPQKLLYNHTVHQYSLTSSYFGYLPLDVEYCEVGNRIQHGVRSMQRLVESTAELKMVARTR